MPCWRRHPIVRQGICPEYSFVSFSAQLYEIYHNFLISPEGKQLKIKVSTSKANAAVA